jgi:hypothetical protein
VCLGLAANRKTKGEFMSETVYDLSKYPRHQEANKPYAVIYPDSEETDGELSRMFDVQKHVSAFAKEHHKEELPENAFLRLAKAIPMGQTPQEDRVFLVLQGVLHEELGFQGGWFVVTCDELGIDELHQDLEDFERQAIAEIEEMVEQATREAKKRGKNK